MRRRTIPYYILYAITIVSGIATFVEDCTDTARAHAIIYDAVWFKALWAVLVLALTGVTIRRKLWKRLPDFLLHLSFVLMFAGAVTSSLSGKNGIIHLRKNIPVREYITQDKQWESLPLTLRLDTFYIEHYEGTETPADYVSLVRCTESGEQVRISMNRIFTYDGHRFYQSSFDEDLQGSWLTVNYDPWGTDIVYTGFILAILSALWLLLTPGGNFRRLLRHPLLKKGGLFVLLAVMATGAQAASQLPVVVRPQADSLTRKPIIYNGRIAPFNTLARDFVRKLYGQDTYKGLTPEQVVSSWLLYPDEWSHVPIIRIKDGKLRAALKLDTPYASQADLFNGTIYRLQTLLAEHHELQKAIRETDEKMGLILMLREGTLIKAVPEGTAVDMRRLHAERLYNRIPFSKILFMVNLTLGLFTFGLMLRRMLCGRGGNIFRRNALWTILLGVITLFHAAGYGLRWYVCGHIPLSNGFETMQFLSLSALAVTYLCHRRFAFLLPFGLLLSGFTLLVAHLGEMNPQITPLMPVLASPWLSSHVSMIMLSYALFAFISLNAALALCLMYRQRRNPGPHTGMQIEQLTLLNRLLLYPAVFFLGTGIILGAVWANVSWGSYWSWDPKEVWALVTFIIYGMAFHPYALNRLGSPRWFHVYMLAAFLSILMTYFGVNYLLGGMHSYASAG